MLYEGETANIDELRARAPEAIAAPLGTAIELACERLSGRIEIPSLSFAFVILTDLVDVPLEASHRDLLWRAFRVPLFEQLRDWEGNVMARECEVHNGLHLLEGVGARMEQGRLWVGNRKAERSGTITEEHCECGAETEILRDLAIPRPGRAAAA